MKLELCTPGRKVLFRPGDGPPREVEILDALRHERTTGPRVLVADAGRRRWCSEKRMEPLPGGDS